MRTIPNIGLLTMLLSAIPGAAVARPVAATFWGVSDSGMEFGRGLKAGTNYVIPDPGYYLSQGLTLIRLPIQMQRLAPDPGRALDPRVLAALETIVGEDEAAGAVTVLDLHGFGFLEENGQPKDLLLDGQAQADYLDLLGRVADAFRGRNVALGLMNEPHTGSDAAYAPLWNRAIATIRRAGFHGTVLVPHSHWDAASDISERTPYASDIEDPDHDWVLELHLYLDPDDTGTYRRRVADEKVGVERVDGAIRWARERGVRIFLGETGGPADPIALKALSALLDHLDAARDAVWGVALWGAGPWWKPNYPMRLDPVDGAMRPQLAALQAVAHPQLVYLSADADTGTARVRLAVDAHQPGPPVSVSVDRFHGIQPVPVAEMLSAGRHVIRIVPAGPVPDPVYVTGASWKGISDSDDAFRSVGSRGSDVHVLVPSRATEE